MNTTAPTEIARRAEEGEQQILAAARAAVVQEGHNKFEVGRLASKWTKKYADGRGDADFGKSVGLSGSQVQQRRETFETFGDVYHMYCKLTWSHFNVATAWNDSEEWIGEAQQKSWSVAEMKRQRAEANAAIDESIGESVLAGDASPDSNQSSERVCSQQLVSTNNAHLVEEDATASLSIDSEGNQAAEHHSKLAKSSNERPRPSVSVVEVSGKLEKRCVCVSVNRI